MKEGWTYKKFVEVFDLQMGKTPSRDNSLYWGGLNTWVSIADLQHKYISSSKENITDLAVSESNIKSVKKGTVIMSFKLTVGRCAIAAKDLFTNEAIMAFTPIQKEVVIPEYIYYFLKGYRWTGANKAVMGMTLNKKSISNNVFAYPPLAEQERIVAELDLLSSVIEKKKAQLSEYDQLAQSIFYSMFGDPITNEKGWEVKKLEEVVASDCSISYGIVQPGEDISDGVPIVRPVDLTNTKVSRKGLKRVDKSISDAYKRTILKGNEILFCVRGTTGVVSFASEELCGCNVTRGITPLSFDNHSNPYFIFHLIKTDGMQAIISDKTRGIALKQINMKDVRLLPIILPPLSLQQEFAEKIEAIEKQKELIKQSIAETETLFNSRMDYYFN